MKKYIAVLLCLSLLLALTACGGREQESSAAQTTQAPTEAAAEAPAEEATEAAENPLALGRMEGGVYSNTYGGFGCTLDESWTFYSAQELQQLPEAVKDALGGSEMGEALEGLESITDMMAENVELMCTMNVLYQKMDMQTRLAAAATSEESLVDSVLAQKDTLIATYAQAGMEITDMEKTTVTFLGRERFAVRTTGATQGVPLHMIQIFDYTRGAYSITMTFTSFGEDNTAAMLDLYYPVD